MTRPQEAGRIVEALLRTASVLFLEGRDQPSRALTIHIRMTRMVGSSYLRNEDISLQFRKRLEINLQKVHDVRVVDPPRHFPQQPVVPNIVKVGAQIKVEDPR